MILVEDTIDMQTFLMQFNPKKNLYKLQQSRKTISNLYFFECMGWLINYVH